MDLLKLPYKIMAIVAITLFFFCANNMNTVLGDDVSVDAKATIKTTPNQVVPNQPYVINYENGVPTLVAVPLPDKVESDETSVSLGSETKGHIGSLKGEAQVNVGAKESNVDVTKAYGGKENYHNLEAGADAGASLGGLGIGSSTKFKITKTSKKT